MTSIPIPASTQDSFLEGINIFLSELQSEPLTICEQETTFSNLILTCKDSIISESTATTTGAHTTTKTTLDIYNVYNPINFQSSYETTTAADGSTIPIYPATYIQINAYTFYYQSSPLTNTWLTNPEMQGYLRIEENPCTDAYCLDDGYCVPGYCVPGECIVYVPAGWYCCEELWGQCIFECFADGYCAESTPDVCFPEECFPDTCFPEVCTGYALISKGDIYVPINNLKSFGTFTFTASFQNPISTDSQLILKDIEVSGYTGKPVYISNIDFNVDVTKPYSYDQVQAEYDQENAGTKTENLSNDQINSILDNINENFNTNLKKYVLYIHGSSTTNEETIFNDKIRQILKSQKINNNIKNLINTINPYKKSNTYEPCFLNITNKNETYYLNYIIRYSEEGIIYIFLDLTNLKEPIFSKQNQDPIIKFYLINKIDINTKNVIINDQITDDVSHYKFMNNKLYFVSNNIEIKSWELYIGSDGLNLSNYKIKIPNLIFTYEDYLENISNDIFTKKEFKTVVNQKTDISIQKKKNKDLLKYLEHINFVFDPNNYYLYNVKKNKILKIKPRV